MKGGKTNNNTNNTLIENQQPKIDNVNNSNNNNKTLVIGFSICCKFYLMKYFLFKKQDPISNGFQRSSKCVNRYSSVFFDNTFL